MDKSKGSKNQEQVIYDRLFDVILEQKLQPGARLIETPLSEVFGVSRTIIRKVLLRLSLEGVVEIKPNLGASVVTTPPEDVPEFFEARRQVEGILSKMLTGNLTDYQEQTLRSIVKEENRLLKNGNLAKGLRKSTEFHFYIVEAAGNKPLAEFGKQMIARTSLIVSQYNLPGSGGCACVDHTQLVDAMAAGDGDEVQRLMHLHIGHIEDQLQIREQESEPDLYELFKD